MEELKSKDTLGDRMKLYEKNVLELEQNDDSYVMIRLDGNAFHTWVKKAKLMKPFDERFIDAMQLTTKFLCEQIPTCIMGYVQSDEISLVLRKGENKDSQYWFDNRIQKLCSISASMAAAFFNDKIKVDIPSAPLAFFDARVMFMPTLDECINCLIWRQKDCIRNSILGLAQSMFSLKELLNKRCEEMKEMMKQKDVIWDNQLNWIKYGTLVHKRNEIHYYNNKAFNRGAFFVDFNTPKFVENKQFLIDAYDFKVEVIKDDQDN